jgi:stage II sporulation protein D
MLLLAATALPAWADVRVLLFQTQQLQNLTLSSDTGFEVRDLKTHALLLTCRPRTKLLISRTGSALRLKGPRTLTASGPICLENNLAQHGFSLSTPATPPRLYTGTLEIGIYQQNLKVINQLAETTYLCSAVANEMSPAWPAEALKTQAILARTYVAFNRGRHRAVGADFCDLTHCQVYKGTSSDPRVAEAVQATQGLILTYRGKAINAVFHSVCGGKTAAARDVWNASLETPYLISVSDRGPGGDYCQAAQDHSWQFEASREQLEKQLAASGVSLPAPLSDIRTDPAPESGRVLQVQLICRDGSSRTLSGDAFYRAWGRGGHWQQLKSTWFTVALQGDQFHFQGHGSGHGVGLCQWGARGRALAGLQAAEILKHYFPGTELTREKTE